MYININNLKISHWSQNAQKSDFETSRLKNDQFWHFPNVINSSRVKTIPNFCGWNLGYFVGLGLRESRPFAAMRHTGIFILLNGQEQEVPYNKKKAPGWRYIRHARAQRPNVPIKNPGRMPGFFICISYLNNSLFF